MSTHLIKHLFPKSNMLDCGPIPLVELAPKLVGKTLLYKGKPLKIMGYIKKGNKISFVTKLGESPPGYSNYLAYIENNVLYYGVIHQCNEWRFYPVY